MHKRTIRIIVALVILAFVYCTKNDEVFLRDNPLDPGGTNWPPSAVMIPAAGKSFLMGQTGIAEPVHSVTFFYNFYIDCTEVTQADYQALMGVNPSYFSVDTMLPVEQVTWFDAVLYCNKRSLRDLLDTVYRYTSATVAAGKGCSALGGLVIDTSQKGYRLPTEAEWEYACRAGTTTKCFWGYDSSAGESYAWLVDNSGGRAHAVATRQSNAWGLHDMAGNVWEWCNDWYGIYASGSQTNPQGNVTGNFRVQRGGSWTDDAASMRSANRSGNNPDSRSFNCGFRCVKEIPATITAPQTPSHITPLNGSTGQSPSLKLNWSAVSGAATYRVQLSTNVLFSARIIDDSTLTTTSKTAESLSISAMYYWRVRSKNGKGTSAWSAPWSFSTGAGPWFTKARMPTARYAGVAVLNNMIYAIGGINAGGTVAAVEVYDPSTNTWTAKPNMSAAGIPAVAVVNNKIYVIGGGDITTVQEYAPVANTWITKTSMPTPRCPYVAVVNNKIYAIGGYNTITGSLSTNEEYDPSSNTWTVKTGMPTARNGTPVAAANGKVYAIGGEYYPNSPYATVEEYDPSTNAWTTNVNMPTARKGAAAGVVNNKIYVIGGSNTSDLTKVELYDPATNTWTTKASMPTARSFLGVAVVNNKIYAIGGGDGNGYLATVEEYDPLLDP